MISKQNSPKVQIVTVIIWMVIDWGQGEMQQDLAVMIPQWLNASVWVQQRAVGKWHVGIHSLQEDLYTGARIIAAAVQSFSETSSGVLRAVLISLFEKWCSWHGEKAAKIGWQDEYMQ